MSATEIVSIITAVGTVLGTGIFTSWFKSKTDLKIKEMEAHYNEQDKIKTDVDRLKEQFEKLYSEHLIVRREHMVLQAKNEILTNQIKELTGYKSQEMKIGRLTRAMNQYYKDQKVDQLIKTFDKELIR